MRWTVPLALVWIGAQSAQAMPVDEYLKLRRQVKYDPALQYSSVAQNPYGYEGKVLELRGTVDGSIRREAEISFLMTLEGGKAILLTAPTNETPLVTEVSHQKIRALVRVASSSVSNVAPLTVLALAHEADIATREAAAEAKAGPKAAPQSARTVRVQPSRGYVARVSGGGYVSDLARKYLTPEAQAIYSVYRQFIQNHNKRLTQAQADAITVAILHFSPRFKVDPRLVIALIIAESDFNIGSTSHKGAMGLGQLTDYEVKALKIPDPYDPVWNIRGAVDLLKGKLDLYKRFGQPNGQLSWQQIELALAAYNAGSGAVRKYGYTVPPYRETQGYVAKVTRLYRQLLGGG